MIDVVMAGHICLDIIPKIPDTGGKTMAELLQPGRLFVIEEAAISTGGPVSNTGLGLKRLGVNVALMSKTGDDIFGKIILDLLKPHVSTAGMKIVRKQQTSYTIALSPPGIDRMFMHNPGPNNTFGYDDINFRLVEKARLFHLGYPPVMRKLYINDGAELAKIYKQVKKLGVTTSLDLALPNPATESGQADWDKILRNILPYVDIALPSLEEISFMLEKEHFMEITRKSAGKRFLDFYKADDLSRLSGKLLEYGAKVACLKCGYRGFYMHTADKFRFADIGRTKPTDSGNWSNRQIWAPAVRVKKVVSATGSGDSAIAGFLAAYLNGKSAELCLKYATAVGAQNVKVLDAVSGIKTWSETTRQVNSNPECDPLEIDTPGWKFDSSRKLWELR